jgi:hypothetical protein
MPGEIVVGGFDEVGISHLLGEILSYRVAMSAFGSVLIIHEMYIKILKSNHNETNTMMTVWIAFQQLGAV